MDREKEIEEMAKAMCMSFEPRMQYNKTLCNACETYKRNCCKAKLLINAGYGNVKEYQAEIERLRAELAHREEDLVHADEKVFYRECEVALNEEKIKKQAVKEFAEKIKDWLHGADLYFYNGQEEFILDGEDIDYKIDELLKEYDHGE